MGDYIEGMAKIMLSVRYPWQTTPLQIEGKMGPNFADYEVFAKIDGPYLEFDGTVVEQFLYL
jgi:hypothetical protein